MSCSMMRGSLRTSWVASATPAAKSAYRYRLRAQFTAARGLHKSGLTAFQSYLSIILPGSCGEIFSSAAARSQDTADQA